MRGMAVCLIVAMLCWSPGSARAADAVPATDRHAIETVIASQLEAFRRDAGDVAFGYASPGIQAMFGDARHFMAMVRQAYPPVYRSRSFTFEAPTSEGDQVVQPVALVGPDGEAALALYRMEREPDGSWRIDGCVLTRPHHLET